MSLAKVKIKKGLNLPITGEPKQEIETLREPQTVAVLGDDYVGMKPTMLVSVGEKVKKGQVLFSDKKNEGVVFTAPASGRIQSINRGDKRSFISIVIARSGSSEETFKKYDPAKVARDDLQKVLVDSGLWTAIRTRPFSKAPALNSSPSSIFVSALDTNPLAANPAKIIAEYADDFNHGLAALTALTEGKVFISRAVDSGVNVSEHQSIVTAEVSGPHPAGLVGTQIHYLDPVVHGKVVWHIGYQDVIAVGKLLTTGKLWTERIISLAGPRVTRPRLVRTHLGASVEDIVQGQLEDGSNRVISGSVFGGVAVQRGPAYYLGRFHTQISVIEEDKERVFLGWQRPGFNQYSIKPIFASSLIPGKKFSFSSSTNGSKRAMVPIGMYEKVMPLDILPTFLLRALITKDIESARALGVLELDEEDMSLCTFVCPGKSEYGPMLRDVLNSIDKDG